MAAHAGVSVGTASRVLNDEASVAADMRERVLLAVEETGYRRLRARTVGAETEIAFLAVLRDVDEARPELDYFWAGILKGAEVHARRSGARISYRALHGLDHDRSVAEQLGGSAPEHALLVGPAPDASIRELRDMGVSLVLVDNAIEGEPIVSVNSDNFGGSLLVMEHLLGLGHRRIAYVGGPPRSGAPDADAIHSISLRTLGYRHALERRGISVDPALVARCDLSVDGAATAVERLLDDGAQFSAVFCANDPAAAGAIRALRRRGLSVPGHVSVAGYDDQFGDHVEPRLTTVRVDRTALGATAVDALLAVARAAHPLPPATRVVPVEFVRGASTSAPVALAPVAGAPEVDGTTDAGTVGDSS
ncbi:LacI family DNA-binding transcriptional regulator [Georgenia alba]|uniref:LacI family DNA-binding transcriptional regulator n=1 Tax=Georgenia alba TaxID=2233858 RepID=A0ABW2QCD1_9MICO